MEKRVVFVALFAIATIDLLGQVPPVIEWQRCLGGTSTDLYPFLQPLDDGGCIVLCSTESNDGDVSGNNGGGDTWVVRLDEDGGIIWQDCYGGTAHDAGRHIYPTSDGGSFSAGKSTSADGDVGENNGNYDLWALKLDPDGAIEWESSFGGSEMDYSEAVVQSMDGEYLAAGRTSSQDGDVSGFLGSADAWVVRIDATGELLWQHCYGGSIADEFYDMARTTDGGFALTGWTTSTDGDVVGNHGSSDAWVVKIDDTGAMQWQLCVGGTAAESTESIAQTSDGGFVVAGGTYSNDGDITALQGTNDGFVAKLSSNGALEWTKCLGGTGSERINDIRPCADGGYIVGGFSTSTDNGFECNTSGSTAWLAKLSSTGVIQWQMCLGGEGSDSVWAIAQAPDGGFYLVVQTSSTTGDVSCQQGAYDAWVIKLRSESTGLPEPSSSATFLVGPNPTEGPVAIECMLDESTSITLNWFDASRRLLLSEPHGLQPAGSVRLRSATPNAASGIYFLQIRTQWATTIYRVVRLP